LHQRAVRIQKGIIHMSDIKRLREWTNAKRRDPAYRAAERAKSRARLEQLKADAAFGRRCRDIFSGLQVILDLINEYNNASSNTAKNTTKGK